MPRTKDLDVGKSLSFLDDLLDDYSSYDFAVRLWEGTTWNAQPGRRASFTLALDHPGALRAMFWPPDELPLAEACIHGDFDIEGSIEAVSPWLTTFCRAAAVRLNVHARPECS